MSKMDLGGADRQFVNALARGLNILGCFSPGKAELSMAEISKMVGLPQPTVWRLCHTLLSLGYLDQSSADNKLRPGLRVLTLGYATLTNFPLAELAGPHMKKLAERFDGSVSLGARQGGLEIVYLQRCVGSVFVFAELGVGSRIRISNSVSGWAYLAALPEPDRRALISAIEVSEGARWCTLQPRLKKAIAEYRRLGFIVQKGLLHPDLNSAAATFRVQGREDPFTLSGGGIASRFDDAKLQALGEALVGLAALLGSTRQASNR